MKLLELRQYKFPTIAIYKEKIRHLQIKVHGITLRIKLKWLHL